MLLNHVGVMIIPIVGCTGTKSRCCPIVRDRSEGLGTPSAAWGHLQSKRAFKLLGEYMRKLEKSSLSKLSRKKIKENHRTTG